MAQQPVHPLLHLSSPPLLGIDAHAKRFYVARQIDRATPQPVEKMTFDGLLRFVAKQRCLAREALPLESPFSSHRL